MSTPLALYIDLEPGQLVDFDVACKAGLAFSAAIREVAYVMDPGIDVRVELLSGSEGSLSLNSIIRVLRDEAKARPILAAVSLTALGWFGNWSFNEVMDHIKGPDVVRLAPEQLDEVAERVARNLSSGVARNEVQRVYGELERDEAVRAVGATLNLGARPLSLVPRGDFAMRADHLMLVPGAGPRRTRTDNMTVRLISPVLVTGRRRWKFQSPEGEFGADIRDVDFADDLIEGRIVLPMVGGIELDVQLATTEDFDGRVWVPVERHVLRVYGHRLPPRQHSLLSQ